MIGKRGIPPVPLHPFLLEQEGSIVYLDYHIGTASFANIMITSLKEVNIKQIQME